MSTAPLKRGRRSCWSSLRAQQSVAQYSHNFLRFPHRGNFKLPPVAAQFPKIATSYHNGSSPLWRTNATLVAHHSRATSVVGRGNASSPAIYCEGNRDPASSMRSYSNFSSASLMSASRSVLSCLTSPLALKDKALCMTFLSGHG